MGPLAPQLKQQSRAICFSALGLICECLFCSVRWLLIPTVQFRNSPFSACLVYSCQADSLLFDVVRGCCTALTVWHHVLIPPCSGAFGTVFCSLPFSSSRVIRTLSVAVVGSFGIRIRIEIKILHDRGRARIYSPGFPGASHSLGSCGCET
jgi:hypothetical protein